MEYELKRKYDAFHPPAKKFKKLALQENRENIKGNIL